MYSELTKAKPLIWCMYVCLCQWRYHLTSISVELGFSHSNDCFCAICQLCITGRDSFTLSPQAVKSCQTPGGSFLCLPWFQCPSRFDVFEHPDITFSLHPGHRHYSSPAPHIKCITFRPLGFSHCPGLWDSLFWHYYCCESLGDYVRIDVADACSTGFAIIPAADCIKCCVKIIIDRLQR